MGLDADAVLAAFWEAADDLPQDAIPEPHFHLLLAGICERLHQVEPSESFQQEIRESRYFAERNEQLVSGEQVLLGYSYSTLDDGIVELETYNAEVTVWGEEENNAENGWEDVETGTVFGKPGARIQFNEAEARRAIQILSMLFPTANSGDTT